MASHMYTHTHTHTVHCLWHGRLVASSDCEAVWEHFLPRSYRKDWLSILLQGMFMYSGLQACVMALTPLHSVQWRTVVSSQSRQKRFLDCSVESLCSPTLRRESITLIGRYVPAIIRFSSPAVTCIVVRLESMGFRLNLWWMVLWRRQHIFPRWPVNRDGQSWRLLTHSCVKVATKTSSLTRCDRASNWLAIRVKSAPSHMKNTGNTVGFVAGVTNHTSPTLTRNCHTYVEYLLTHHYYNYYWIFLLHYICSFILHSPSPR